MSDPAMRNAIWDIDDDLKALRQRIDVLENQRQSDLQFIEALFKRVKALEYSTEKETNVDTEAFQVISPGEIRVRALEAGLKELEAKQTKQDERITRAMETFDARIKNLLEYVGKVEEHLVDLFNHVHRRTS